MDCYCTSNRKSNKDDEIQKHKDAVTKYWTEMKKIESEEKLKDGSNIQIECSYLLCCRTGDKPLIKQAICRNIPHYFCSEDCWTEWVKEPRTLSKHDFYSPVLSPLIKSNSPEYMKYFDIKNGGNINIYKIPYLSI
jgi:hypothetical protein